MASYYGHGQQQQQEASEGEASRQDDDPRAEGYDAAEEGSSMSNKQWQVDGKWFETPQGWYWGKSLDDAVEYGMSRGWIVDVNFLDWWSSVKKDGEGCDDDRRSSGSSGHARAEGARVGGSVVEGSRNGSVHWSRESRESTKESSGEKRANRGKDFIPVHDGRISMREYSRRVKLFQATTAIDVEYQGGRLVEKLEGDAWAACETLDLRPLRSPRGVQKLLDHLWNELEPLAYLRTMNTLNYFYKEFQRGSNEEFSHYDTCFRAQCLRLTEINSPISGTTKAFWFLEKANIPEHLRRSVIAAAGGEYDYKRLREALCAIVPQVKRGTDDAHHAKSTGYRRWDNYGKPSNKVHAVAADPDDDALDGAGETPPGDDDLDELGEIDELEAEAQIMMTHAAKRRAEMVKNRGCNKSESREQRESRIDAMKKRMACAACRSHGKIVYGHWHGDDICPYKNQPSGKKQQQATFVVSQPEDGDDSSEEAFHVNFTLNPEIKEEQIFASVLAAASPSRQVRKSVRGVALSDTCCARTVCGHKWMRQHWADLGERGLPYCIEDHSQPFRFGDGPRVESDYAVICPLLIAKCRRVPLLRISVVSDDVPLLVWKGAGFGKGRL